MRNKHKALSRLRTAAVESGTLAKGDSVLICVSGGADSVALLHLLRFGLSDYRLKLTACHLHHGLREAADEDLSFVRRLCNKWNIPLVVAKADTAAYAKKQGQGIEAAGRSLRYAFFARTARRYGCNKIATAHTLNDQAETVLLRLIRGSGAKGLCGIPPGRGKIIRPLLGVRRSEIEDYLTAFSIPHREDESNHTADYTRNRVRYAILPLLLQENPRFPEAAGRLADALRADEEYLTAQTAKLEETAKRPDGYELSVLRAAHPALLRRFCLSLLDQKGSAVRCEQLMRVILTGGRAGDFYAAGGLLYRGAPQKGAAYALPLTPGGTVLPDGRRVESWIETIPCQNIHKNALFPPMDYDKIKGILQIHSRKGGESLTLSRRGVTKSIKKLCQEAGIPPEERGRLLFLSDEAGTVAVERLGVTARVEVDDRTKRVLIVQTVGDREA